MFPRIVFSDFDGTLTHGSSLGSLFFEIISVINEKQSSLVIVTGRSLSWAHFLLTHTEIQTVISEGGGMISFKHDDERIEDICLVTEAELTDLQASISEFHVKFPHVPLSIDSFGRKTDRAIELYELSDLKKTIQEFFDSNKINHSCSSVHLNFWKGNISKYNAVKYFMDNFISGVTEKECIYFGDSLNDESMFQFFQNSVGVSNIHHVLKDLKFAPSIILNGPKNIGPDGVLNHLSSLISS